MKNIEKIFAVLLVAAAPVAFLGCSEDTEEDEKLVVSIKADGSDFSENRNVTISIPF